MDYVLQLAAAFSGSMGFALLFQVRRGKLLLASLGGLLAWAVYLALGPMIPQDVPRFFIASVVLTIYGEILARVVKCPATLFLVTAAVPLIPAGSLSPTMRYFGAGDFAACPAQGLNPLLLALAIAAGRIVPTSLFQLVRRVRVWRQRRDELKK